MTYLDIEDIHNKTEELEGLLLILESSLYSNLEVDPDKFKSAMFHINSLIHDINYEFTKLAC